MRTRSAAFMVLAFLLAVSGNDARDVGRLYGTVVDETGKPLEGVSITVTGQGAVGIYTARTGPDGSYSFQGLPLREPLDVEARLLGKVSVIYRGILARDVYGERRDFRLRPAGRHEFLILTDPQVPAYRTVLDGILTLLPGTSTTLELTGQRAADGARLRESLAGAPNAVVTIGTYAARLARRNVKTVPIVSTMVISPRKNDLSIRNMCGLVVNGDYEGQIDELSKIDPSASRVLTVYNAHRLDREVRRLRDVLESRGMSLTAITANTPEDLEEVLGSEAASFDAFFVVFDPELITPEAYRRIVEFSRSRHLILIVPDPSLVEQGGTFSYAPGFHEMGVQAAEIVRQILDGRSVPAKVGFRYPDARTLTRTPSRPD